MKEKIYVTYYEDDGQVDVEVYEWNEEEQEKGKFLRDLSEYAFPSRLSANEHVETLKKNYEIIKETSIQEEEEKFAEEMKAIDVALLKEFKPKYLTYEIDTGEMEIYIQNYLSKKCRYPVKVELDSPYDSIDEGNCVEVKIASTDNPEWVVRMIAEYYEKRNDDYLNIADKVFSEIFKGNIKDVYWHPSDYTVIVNVWLDK